MKALRFFAASAVLSLLLCFSCFAAAPEILSQPQNFYFPQGTTFPTSAHFSVLASGDNLTYQWEYSRDNGSSWIASSSVGYNSSNYSPVIQNSGAVGYLYRCRVSGLNGEAITSVVSTAAATGWLGTVDQLVDSVSLLIGNVLDNVGLAASAIITTPLLLIGVSFSALAFSIAILSRFLSRS